jgi:hypothetical protein
MSERELKMESKKIAFIILTSIFVLASVMMVSAEKSTLYTDTHHHNLTKAGIVFEKNSIQSPPGADFYYLGFMENRDGNKIYLRANNVSGGIQDQTLRHYSGNCSALPDSAYQKNKAPLILGHNYCVLSGDRTRYILVRAPGATDNYDTLNISWTLEPERRLLLPEEVEVELNETNTTENIVENKSQAESNLTEDIVDNQSQAESNTIEVETEAKDSLIDVESSAEQQEISFFSLSSARNHKFAVIAFVLLDLIILLGIFLVIKRYRSIKEP